MKYSEWNSLSDEERQNTNWHKHPRVRTATLFSITFAIAFIIVILGISKNTTVHLNRKPTTTEAFAIAKVFVKEKLKQPEKAIFAKSAVNAVANDADNSYSLSSSVKIENNNGKMDPSNWEVKMRYTGGDWAERNSWQVTSVTITPQP